MASWCSKCGRNYCECENIQQVNGFYDRINNNKPLSSNFESYGYSKGYYGDGVKLNYGPGGYHPNRVKCDMCGKSMDRIELPIHDCK